MSIVKINMTDVTFEFAVDYTFSNDQIYAGLRGDPEVYKVDEDEFKSRLSKTDKYVRTFVRFEIDGRLYVGRAWYSSTVNYFLLYCPPGRVFTDEDKPELSILKDAKALLKVVKQTGNYIRIK